MSRHSGVPHPALTRPVLRAVYDLAQVMFRGQSAGLRPFAISLAYFLDTAPARPTAEPPGQETLRFYMINPDYLVRHRQRLEAVGCIEVRLRQDLIDEMRRRPTADNPVLTISQIVHYVLTGILLESEVALLALQQDQVLWRSLQAGLAFANKTLCRDQTYCWR